MSAPCPFCANTGLVIVSRGAAHVVTADCSCVCVECNGDGYILVSNENGNSPFARAFREPCPKGCEEPPRRPRARCHCCGEFTSRISLFGFCPEHEQEFGAFDGPGATMGHKFEAFLKVKAEALVARVLSLVEVVRL